MNHILINFKSKEFYKNNWHRFLVAPILFFALFFTSMVYLISAGFYVIFYVSLLIGFILSIIFAINYNKYYFFGLVFIILLQIITVNIDTKNYQYQIKYWDFCPGFTRNYYESTYCVSIKKLLYWDVLLWTMKNIS